MKRTWNRQHERREKRGTMRFGDWLHEGMEVEREHTRNKRLQRKIALDHLREHPGYYKALKTMEKKLKRTPKKVPRRC